MPACASTLALLAPSVDETRRILQTRTHSSRRLTNGTCMMHGRGLPCSGGKPAHQLRCRFDAAGSRGAAPDFKFDAGGSSIGEASNRACFRNEPNGDSLLGSLPAQAMRSTAHQLVASLEQASSACRLPRPYDYSPTSACNSVSVASSKCSIRNLESEFCL